MDRLTRVREVVVARLPGDSTRATIAHSFSHGLEKQCAYLWPQNKANGYRTGTHLNRAIYANVAYRKFRAPGESLTHFIKTRLGHDTMGSAANYMNISIAFETDEDLMKEAESQSWILDDFKVGLVDNSGEVVKMTPPPIRKLSEQDRIDEVDFYATKLVANDIKLNRANLMALGLQSNIITLAGVLLKEE